MTSKSTSSTQATQVNFNCKVIKENNILYDFLECLLGISFMSLTTFFLKELFISIIQLFKWIILKKWIMLFIFCISLLLYIVIVGKVNWVINSLKEKTQREFTFIKENRKND